MQRFRKAMLAAAIAGSFLVGGVGGAVIGITALTASAASPTPNPTGGSAAAPSGKFVSNETAAHEATESAAREAQENAGQVPTVP